jgi:hypothetical protein
MRFLLLKNANDQLECLFVFNPIEKIPAALEQFERIGYHVVKQKVIYKRVDAYIQSADKERGLPWTTIRYQGISSYKQRGDESYEREVSFNSNRNGFGYHKEYPDFWDQGYKGKKGTECIEKSNFAETKLTVTTHEPILYYIRLSVDQIARLNLAEEEISIDSMENSSFYSAEPFSHEPTPLSFLLDSFGVDKTELLPETSLSPENIVELLTMAKKLLAKEMCVREISGHLLASLREPTILGLMSTNISAYNEVDRKKRERARNYVLPPLLFLSDLIKNILSYTIGFHWFLELTHSRRSNGVYIEPSTIIFDKDDLGISLGTQRYKVTWYNFRAVGLDIFARNLGKLIGGLIAGLYSVPAYFVVSVQSYREKAQLQATIVRELKGQNKHALVFQWLQSDGDAKIGLPLGFGQGLRSNSSSSGYQVMSTLIAEHITAFEFLQAIISQSNKIGRDGFESEVTSKIKDFVNRRLNFCESDLERQLLNKIGIANLGSASLIKAFADELEAEGEIQLATFVKQYIRPDIGGEVVDDFDWTNSEEPYSSERDSSERQIRKERAVGRLSIFSSQGGKTPSPGEHTDEDSVQYK